MTAPAELPGYGLVGGLAARYIAPPFSVLDTRQGYWQARRRSWLALGIRSEIGRGRDLLDLQRVAERKVAGVYEAPAARQLRPGGNYRSDGGMFGTNGKPSLLERQRAPSFRRDWSDPGRGGLWAPDEAEPADPISAGSSIFDPVLCELVYRWWAPPGGAVLDPFAGGSVRGVVAGSLGHPYTGIDLSAEQIEANREQAGRLELAQPPRWIHGDSLELDSLLPAGEEFDLVFTCPPYFDLERYSDDPRDLSNAGSFGEFMTDLGIALHRAAARLRDGRFAVVVVSEIRDRDGYCRGLPAATVAVAQQAGLRLYNDAVLLNAAGTLPLRVGAYMEASRKLGRAHQNVLCFVKGSPPRGWDHQRSGPPDPQLELWAELAP